MSASPAGSDGSASCQAGSLKRFIEAYKRYDINKDPALRTFLTSYGRERCGRDTNKITKQAIRPYGDRDRLLCVPIPSVEKEVAYHIDPNLRPARLPLSEIETTAFKDQASRTPLFLASLVDSLAARRQIGVAQEDIQALSEEISEVGRLFPAHENSLAELQAALSEAVESAGEGLKNGLTISVSYISSFKKPEPLSDDDYATWRTEAVIPRVAFRLAIGKTDGIIKRAISELEWLEMSGNDHSVDV